MNRILSTALGLAFGLVLGSSVAALASRNSSGTYTLPTGNPVVSGTTITSTWANATLGDIKTELTDSLSRSGKGGMTAPLRCAPGSASAPTYSWTAETASGLYRNGAGDIRMAVGSADAQTWSGYGATVPGTLVVGGTLGVTGAATLAGVSAGAVSAASAAISGAASVGTTLAVTGATTLTGGVAGNLAVSGTTTATGGLAVGSAGTTMTGSYRGSVTQSLNVLATNCASLTISVPGAIVGADCIVSATSSLNIPGLNNGLCSISSAGSCQLTFCNRLGVDTLVPTSTFYCRAFNQ